MGRTTGYTDGERITRASKRRADPYLRLLSRTVDRAIRDCGSSDDTRRREAARWIFSSHEREQEWSLRWVLARIDRRCDARGPSVQQVRRLARMAFKAAENDG